MDSVACPSSSELSDFLLGKLPRPRKLLLKKKKRLAALTP